MKLEGIRQQVFLDRYSFKDEKGKSTEQTPDEMWRRVAHGIAQIEKPALRKKWEEKFYAAMEDFKFVPAGRILSGAGTGYQVTYFNCFVIPSPKDSRHGILKPSANSLRFRHAQVVWGLIFPRFVQKARVLKKSMVLPPVR